MENSVKQCRYCDKDFFKKYRSLKSWSQAKFCSYNCYWKNMKGVEQPKEVVENRAKKLKGKKRTPEQIARLKKAKTLKRVLIECKECNVDFEVIITAKEKRKYCSQNCANKAIGRGKYRTILKCKNCKKDFNNGHLKAKFCSLGCRNKWRVGERNNLWKGGTSSWYNKMQASKEWSEWRTKVFERDDYTCQHCGYRRGMGFRTRFLHPHHVKSATQYKLLVFDIDNGLTLCHSCHGKVHYRSIVGYRKQRNKN